MRRNMIIKHRVCQKQHCMANCQSRSCLASSATIFVLSDMQRLFLYDWLFFPALAMTLRKCMKVSNWLAEK